MEPIAVVGMGCVVPGALNLTTYWANVLAGKVSLIQVPERAWNHSLYFDADRAIPDKTYVQRGGFVEGFAVDWKRFKIPPADAAAVNPMQWMVLEAGCQAMAGVNAVPNESAGVILGSTGLGWQRDSGMRIRLEDMLDAVRESDAFKSLGADQRSALLELATKKLTSRLKEVSEDNVVGASASVAAGRINMQFNFKGPHSSIDAGFASSLAALDLSVRALRDGELDLVVTGGVSEMLTPLELIAFSKLGALSGSDIRPFDERADGTMLGEGVGLVTLKRLSDALRAKDTIYAVIRGVGGSSDGRGKSLVAPRFEGQALAMRRALDDAGEDFTASSVSYIECHASGTQVGDASEVRALTEVYSNTGTARASVGLGSVKANIGHLRSGAGAAGLLKTILSLHHRKLAPQPGFGSPSKRLELDSTPFYIVREARDFPNGQLPRAAVSAFSFGGNNFHAVLEAYDDRSSVQSVARAAAQTTTTTAHASRSSQSSSLYTGPLAIIGMGGAFPGADNVPQFWEKLLAGYDRTSRVPKDRYDIDRYFAPGTHDKNKSYTDLGCFLDTLPKPDASMKIPPAAWDSLDPSHVLCLKSTEEALRDARYSTGKWNPERVAVSLAFLPYQGKKFLADSRVNWNELRVELANAMAEQRLSAAQQRAVLEEAEHRFKSGLPRITEDTLTGSLGSLNAGRICWLHDFKGPHFVVDAACASTHAALQAAWKMLAHGKADVVLTGGVWCDMRPEFFIAACRFNALSQRGSFPFDASADGFIPGEGAGVFVIKRLDDAQRDGDSIRAVLRCVQGSSDGKGRSVLPPSRDGEGLALKRALKAAGVAPASVDYVECHGTGTALGDVVEAQAISDAYGEGRAQPIGIGSAKSNIGHLNAAAGVAGLVKATLSVQNGVIPPSIKVSTQNPKIPENVQVVREKRQWASGPNGGPRRAGVSAFGVGGANFHAIVEEYRPSDWPLKAAASAANVPAPRASPQTPPSDTPPSVLAFAAADSNGVLQQLEQHLTLVTQGQRSLAVALAELKPTGGYRLALTARSLDEATKKTSVLRTALRSGAALDFLSQQGIFVGDASSPLRRAPIAVTFPGQGGQYANMLRAAAKVFPVVQATLTEADTAYQQLAGRTLTSTFFTDDPERYQQRDADIHAAVFVVNVALYRLLRSWGAAPAMLIGQSAGELAALVAAQSLSFSQGLQAIYARTEAVLSLRSPDPGGMLALGCSAEDASALLDRLPGYAALAADNGPKACIISADRVASAELERRCGARNVECTKLDVSHGYHSKLIAQAREPYMQTLELLQISAPKVPLISTIDGKPYDGVPKAGFPAWLASQFVEPVRLRPALLAAQRMGARIFIEAGPKWSLTQFTRETLKEVPHAAMASIHPKVGELEQLGRLQAFCFVHELLDPARLNPAESIVMSRPPPGIPKPAVPMTQLPPSEALMALPLAPVLEPGTARKLATALAMKSGVDANGLGAEDLISLSSIIAWVERKKSGMAAAPAQPAAAVKGTEMTVDLKTLRSEVAAVLLENVVTKTGYPAEMLGDDLDLEADLGIDTVKQVEIFAKTREHFAVARDPNLTLRSFNTLRKVVDHLVERIAQSRASAPAMQSSSASQVKPAPMMAAVTSSPSAVKPAVLPTLPPPGAQAVSSDADIEAALLKQTMEKTGYPQEMLGLDLDLEADLGIDTVKQVEIFSKTREQLGVARDAAFVLRDFNTLRKFIGYLSKRVPRQAAAPAAAPVTVSAAPTMPTSVRATLMSMDLTNELGLSAMEKERLAQALATQLGLPAPDVKSVSTLDDLVRMLEHGKGRS